MQVADDSHKTVWEQIINGAQQHPSLQHLELLSCIEIKIMKVSEHSSKT